MLLEYKKRCSCCREYGGKDGCGFCIRRVARDGLSSTCRKCKSIYEKIYRKNNREKIKKYRALYRKNDWERAKERYNSDAEYRLKVKAKVSKYYHKNKEAVKVIHAIRYRDALTNSYVAQQIIQGSGIIKAEDVTPEMIELKRELLTFHRLKRRLSDGINSTRD